MIYFHMRANDSGAPGTYRFWIVENAPDATGAQYTGTKVGSLTDIVWLAEIAVTSISEVIEPN